MCTMTGTGTVADRPIVDQRLLLSGLAMIAGGAVMLAIWPIFTTLHGPTSVNEGNELFGIGPEFWSAMIEGPSLLLMAPASSVRGDGSPKTQPALLGSDWSFRWSVSLFPGSPTWRFSPCGLRCWLRCWARV